MAFAATACHGTPRVAPIPKMAQVCLLRIWHISTFGSPLTLLLVPPPRPHPSTHQTALEAHVGYNHDHWYQHPAPPLIEGCGHQVITHMSRTGLPRHWTTTEASKAGHHQRAGDRVKFTRQSDPYTFCLLRNDVPAQTGLALGRWQASTLLVPSRDSPLASTDVPGHENKYLLCFYGIFYTKFFFLRSLCTCFILKSCQPASPIQLAM